MNLLRHTLTRNLHLSLLGGMMAFMAWECAGGQPISFSTPKKEGAEPPKKQLDFNLPKETIKFDIRGPQNDFIPPPIMRIDPEMEKKIKERREEKRDWLNQEPELFRDKLTPPSESPVKNAADDAFKKWDDNVSRFFGKNQSPNSKKDETSLQSFRFTPDTSPFEPRRSNLEQEEPLNSNPHRNSSMLPGMDKRTRNTPEAAARSVFGSDFDSPNPVFNNGMVWDPQPSKAQLKERDAKREEFRALLNASPVALPGNNVAGGLMDLNPSKTGPNSGLAPHVTAVNEMNSTKPHISPFTPLQPVGSVTTPLKPKTEFEEAAAKFQPPARQEKPKDDKVRQLQSLKLMTQPTILSFPSRQ